MPQEVITTPEVEYQRLLAIKLQETYRSWQERFDWYPVRQAYYYRRIPQIYMESRRKYGDDMFQIYATRNRLHSKYISGHKDVPKTFENCKDKQDEEYTVSPTTNGEYGRLWTRNKLYYC